MTLIQSIFRLFYPDLCLGCNIELQKNEKLICSRCRHELPETNFCNMSDNLVKKIFVGRIPLFAGTSLLYYGKNEISQKLIHQLKYKGRQDVGVFFGEWMAKNMLNSKRFKEIEGVVMVPLHPKKQKQRGYNQLTTFAMELSEILEIPIYNEVLIKKSYSISQTKKNRFSRFEKMSEKFHLSDISKLQGKHILLVDDVLTTGATLEACANELLKTPNIKISIATMAISSHI